MSEHIIVPQEHDYSALIGMVPKDGPPIAMERCQCGIISMSAPCHLCRETVDRSPAALQVAPSRRRDGKALLLLSLLVLLAMTWVSWSIDRAPQPAEQTRELS